MNENIDGGSDEFPRVLYDIKTVRICSCDPSGSSGSSGGGIEILVSKPECEQPISRNKDDSFF